MLSPLETFIGSVHSDMELMVSQALLPAVFNVPFSPPYVALESQMTFPLTLMSMLTPPSCRWPPI
jgi:hypothetical protein